MHMQYMKPTSCRCHCSFAYDFWRCGLCGWIFLSICIYVDFVVVVVMFRLQKGTVPVKDALAQPFDMNANSNRFYHMFTPPPFSVCTVDDVRAANIMTQRWSLSAFNYMATMSNVICRRVRDTSIHIYIYIYTSMYIVATHVAHMLLSHNNASCIAAHTQTYEILLHNLKRIYSRRVYILSNNVVYSRSLS